MDTPHSQAPNPFESPSALTIEPSADSKPADERPMKPWSTMFGKWGVVCSVSAAPSFFIAFSFDGDTLPRVAGMLSAILLFVIAYTAGERTRFAQRLLRNRLVEVTAWIGYGTRILITVIFPIGMGLDMLCGVFAISLSSMLTGFAFAGGPSEENFSASFPALFGWYFLTTCIQGVILNIVLFLYMVFVWLIGLAISAMKRI